MTPKDLDTQIVVRRLLLMDGLLTSLREIVGDVERLSEDPITLLAVERVLTQLVELASDINGHAATTRLGRAPGSYRESFTLAADAGLIDARLATDLRPSVGLRNVLVHEYVDVDPDVVRAAAPLALEHYTRYVCAVRDWLTEE